MYRRIGFTPIFAVLIGISVPGVSPSNVMAQHTKPKKAAKSAKPSKDVHGFRVGPKEKVRFAVDAESTRNEISFTSKAPKETFTGKTKEITGDVEFDPHNIAEATGKFTVPWKNLDTGHPMRNQHLYSDPWVNTGEHPDIVLTIAGFDDIKEKSKKGTSLAAKLKGTLSMNGVNHEVTIPVTLVYLTPKSKAKDKETVKEGVGIKAKFKVALKDYNIQGKPMTVGTAVAAVQDINVSLFLAKDGSSTPKPTTPQPVARRPGQRPGA